MGVDILKCYKALDIHEGATAQTIRKAYVELCHVWDPARYVDNPGLRQQAETKRKEIDEAYDAFRAFMPELEGPPDATKHVPIDILSKSIDERDFEEGWSPARVIRVVLIVLVLIGIFWLGAMCLLKLVAHGYA